MKVKMVKMGSDYKTPINCRMRGIVITQDNKHLFVEIGCAYSPNIKNTSLSKNEYNQKYPNAEYVSVDFCFRVDIPEDYYKNCSKEYNKYTRENLFEIPYTKEGIIEFLQKLNKEIDDIELVDDYYIDKYCEEKGFFELYDSRLKHHNELKEVKWVDPFINGEMQFKYKYTCYATNGTEYSEILETKEKITDVIKEYGKDNVKPLVTAYVKDICSSILKSDEAKEHYNQFLKDVFENEKSDLSIELDEEYSDI